MTTENPTTFAERLAESLDALGIEQSQRAQFVASHCNITKRTAARYISSKSTPASSVSLFGLADALRVIPRWLILGESESCANFKEARILFFFSLLPDSQKSPFLRFVTALTNGSQKAERLFGLYIGGQIELRHVLERYGYSARPAAS